MSTLEKLGDNKVKLTIEVPQDVFADAMQKSYIKNMKQYNVPGFRRGKVPRKVIESMYGEGVFYEDAFDLVYADAYDSAVKEHALEPVDRPDISIETIGSQDGVVFTAEVTLKPEVNLGAYTGIEVAEQAYTVEDAQVDALLEQEREKAARFLDTDRPVENGDRVVMDYSGKVDGVQFAGGTATDQVLIIGSGRFIPGFEEQIVGIKTGETKDITVTFPEQYHAEELAGKEAIFTVTVKSVQVKELPELDDEFAKDVSEFDTLDELRADKRKNLEEQAQKNAQMALENAVIEQIVDNTSVVIPDVLIERQKDFMLQDLAYNLQMSGLKLEDYCKYLGKDVTKLREDYREQAEKRVKTQLVLEAIARAEGMEASESEIENEINEYAQRINQSIDQLKSGLSQEDLLYFKDQIIMRKTVAYLVEHAVKKAASVPESEPIDTEAEA